MVGSGWSGLDIAAGDVGEIYTARCDVLVLPYFARGPSTFWQAASGFQFRAADEYIYGGIDSAWTLLKLPAMLLWHAIPTGQLAASQFRTLLPPGRVSRVIVSVPETAGERALLTGADLTGGGAVGGVGLGGGHRSTPLGRHQVPTPALA